MLRIREPLQLGYRLLRSEMPACLPSPTGKARIVINLHRHSRVNLHRIVKTYAMGEWLSRMLVPPVLFVQSLIKLMDLLDAWHIPKIFSDEKPNNKLSNKVINSPN